MGHRERMRDGIRSFGTLAARPCPGRVDLLGAAAAAFTGEPAVTDTDFALDELSRSLFGLVADEDAGVCAEQIGELLAGHPGFTADARAPQGLLLDCVIAGRVGHPLMLAVVAAELGRRAGMRTGVFSSRLAWYAGVSDGAGLWLVDTTDDGDLGAPDQLRRHCPHELAWAMLAGLEERHRACGDPDAAARARRLRAALPREQGGTGFGCHDGSRPP